MSVPALNGSVYTEYVDPAVTQKTISFTVGADLVNSILVVTFAGLSNDLSSATFNGKSLTVVHPSEDSWFYEQFAYIVAPDAGTHDLVLNLPSSRFNVSIQVYTGVNQTTPIPQSVGGYSGTSPMTLNITTTVDDSLLFLFEQGGDPTHTVGTGQTQLWNYTGGYCTTGSYKAAGTAGAKSMYVTHIEDGNVGGIVFALAPFVITTSIKSVAGVAYASIAKIVGVAIASVKSVCGLS